jgi:hypothetical protein
MEPLLFSRKPPVSERQVWAWAKRVKQGDESAKMPLIKFIRHRLKRRYLTPLSKVQGKFRSGFLQMAAGCLLIETLQSFRMGWNNTRRKEQKAFAKFFKNHTAEFPKFRTYFPILPNPTRPRQKIDTFYKNIRCGILHQAETTGGYSIVRDKSPIFSEKTVNANKFSAALIRCINNYLRNLATESCDSRAWRMATKKIRHVCRNFRLAR